MMFLDLIETNNGWTDSTKLVVHFEGFMFVSSIDDIIGMDLAIGARTVTFMTVKSFDGVSVYLA